MRPDRHTTVNFHTGTLKLTVALIPLLGCIAFFWLRNAYFGVFARLFQEDSLFEYLTSAAYIVAATVSIFIARGFWRNRQRVLAIPYALLTIGLFFIAAEEISWGQRLLNIETPQAFAQHNTQGELTIHNLEPIQQVLHWMYVFVGAYGVFMWLLCMPKYRMMPTRQKPYFVPHWYLVPYFFPAFIFYLHLETATRETAWFRYRSPDQEPVEFILSLGFLLFVVINRYRQIQELSLRQCRFVNISWLSKS